MTVLAASVFLGGCQLETRGPVEMVTMDQNRPLAGEAALSATVGLDTGSLEISSTPSDLYALSAEYDRSGFHPEVNYEPGREGRLDFRLKSSPMGGIHERQNNRLRLNLGEVVPVNLKVNTGIGDARLALSRLKITQLDLEAGVGGARISIYDPNTVVCNEIRIRSGVGSLDAVGLGNLNFSRLDFEGGVGGATLDFSGQWQRDADIRIEIGVGGVSVRMPREVGVKVNAEKHFLSGLQLDGFERDRNEDYRSEKYNEKKIRATITVKTGIGGLRISWL
jgi:hypothetical protein